MSLTYSSILFRYKIIRKEGDWFMATKQITVRLDSELEKKVQSEIKKIIKKSRGGTEINLSSVIRYALANYITQQREIDDGVVILKFNLNKLQIMSLKKLEMAMKQLTNVLSGGCDEVTDLAENLFNLEQSIKYKIYQVEQASKNKVNRSVSNDE